MLCKTVALHPDNLKGIAQAVYSAGSSEKEKQFSETGFYHHAEIAFLDTHGPVEWGMLFFRKRPLTMEQMERHIGTPEMVVALDGPIIVPIAPVTQIDGREVPDMSQLTAIYIDQGQGMILDDGQFHWAPFPINETASVLIGFKPKTWADNIIMEPLQEAVEIQLP